MALTFSADRYTRNGVRGVFGLATGSNINESMCANYTFYAFSEIGVCSQALMNFTLNITIVEINTNITSPNAVAAFVQVGLHGAAKMPENTLACYGHLGKARNGQTLSRIDVGLKVQL